MFKKYPTPLSYIRFLHALPVPYGIDIYLDDKLLFKDILYQDFTDYIKVYPGTHTIHCTKTKSTSSFYRFTWHVPQNKVFTNIIAPLNKKILQAHIYKIEESLRAAPPNHLLLRFGHFNMNASVVDVFLSAQTPLFNRVSFHELTNYLAINPGIHSLEVKNSQSVDSLFTAPQLKLKTSRLYSIYAIGDNSKAFPFTVLVALDGSSYLKI